MTVLHYYFPFSLPYRCSHTKHMNAKYRRWKLWIFNFIDIIFHPFLLSIKLTSIIEKKMLLSLLQSLASKMFSTIISSIERSDDEETLLQQRKEKENFAFLFSIIMLPFGLTYFRFLLLLFFSFFSSVRLRLRNTSYYFASVWQILWVHLASERSKREREKMQRMKTKRIIDMAKIKFIHTEIHINFLCYLLQIWFVSHSLNIVSLFFCLSFFGFDFFSFYSIETAVFAPNESAFYLPISFANEVSKERKYFFFLLLDIEIIWLIWRILRRV